MVEQAQDPTPSLSTASTSLPDPSLPAPPLNDEEEGFTAAQLIQRQTELEQAARQAVPFSFSKEGCTYERGYIRQPVYACRTCGGGGVCAACSVGCHAEHDLVELFAKRDFRCDCGTLSLCRGKHELEASLAPCSLRSKELSFAPQNDENKYGRNFAGIFCRCERGKTYDAESEEETMLQCLCCEDWFHESCCSLRPGRSPLVDDIDAPDRSLADGPLVDHDAFDLFICSECVRKPSNEVLRHYVGSRGWIVCLPEEEGAPLPEQVDGIQSIPVIARGRGWQHPWRVYGLERGSASADASTSTVVPSSSDRTIVSGCDSTSGVKRKADDLEETDTAAINDDEQLPKKLKASNTGLSTLDSFSDVDQDEAKGADEPLFSSSEEVCTFPKFPLFIEDKRLPRLDVFLSEDFRSRICRCKGCESDFDQLPFVLTAEETYSPPRSQASEGHADGQSEAGASQTSSTYDLGLAALSQLPRERMMESLQAYNRMRDALFDHLRPFAEQGKMVDAESVREFFRRQREHSQKGV